MSTNRDQIAALLETLTQREIRQIAEYAIDHMEKVDEVNNLADYLRLHRVMNLPRNRNKASAD
jgi:hypothetical protein